MPRPKSYKVIIIFINPPSHVFFLKTLLRKGEIALNEQFLLFPQCFLIVWRTFRHFHHIQNCRLQTLSVWKNLEIIVWERINTCKQQAGFMLKKCLQFVIFHRQVKTTCFCLLRAFSGTCSDILGAKCQDKIKETLLE